VSYGKLGRHALAGMALLALAACGGGGDDMEEPEVDAYPAGLYEGTMTLNGTSRVFRVAVRPDGWFAGGFAAAPGGADSRTLFGTGVVDGNTFTATGTATAPGAAPFPAGGQSGSLTIANGVVDEGVRLQGSYAAGGESGNFDVQFRTEMTGRGALLSRVQGTYVSAAPPGGSSVTFAINVAGAIQVSGNGCTGTGTVSILDPGVNVYSITLSLSGCVPAQNYSGLAALEDGGTGMNNELILFAWSAGNFPFGFTGVK
jgi:hypothetical protein